ncbi:MAG: PIN domain-containing protein [Euryarchaeota archaeon]|nr:PIN domain-containing protein [Euryarchaeota archaeon]
MEFIVDASIIFSFFKSQSFTRNFIKHAYVSGVRLYAPDFLLDELFSLKKKVCIYSGIEEEEFLTSCILLYSLIDVVPKSEYNKFMPRALKVLPGHPKDAAYFALSLKQGVPIWSNEKRFKQQSKIVVFSTHELKKLF